MDTRTLTIPKQADCPVCSKKPDDIKLTYTSPVCQVNDITEISCQDPLIDQAMLVDVREQQEWDKGHIADAVHLPLSELQKNPAQFKPPENGQKTVLYCQKGMRSLKAAEILTNAGFSDLYSLKGGFESWCQARSD
jgi:rhodanese-related sulfurtransferase